MFFIIDFMLIISINYIKCVENIKENERACGLPLFTKVANYNRSTDKQSKGNRETDWSWAVEQICTWNCSSVRAGLWWCKSFCALWIYWLISILNRNVHGIAQDCRSVCLNAVDSAFPQFTSTFAFKLSFRKFRSIYIVKYSPLTPGHTAKGEGNKRCGRKGRDKNRC